MFDVPNGKRLVIESVTVEIDLPSGQRAAVFMQVREPLTDGILTVQSQGVFGGTEALAGTHPIKVRVNGSTATDEVVISVQRNASAGLWIIEAGLYGYLVDL